MNAKDKKILTHIIDYCNDIHDSIDIFSDQYETFSCNRVFLHSVTMCLLQIGELSNKLSDSFIDATSEKIEWHKIKGLRNILAHEYGKIDKETIWKTIHHKIPELKNFCDVSINNLKKEKIKISIHNDEAEKSNNYDIDY